MHAIFRRSNLIPRFTRNLHSTSTLLAGHSKWANIRHDKAKNDAKKSKEAYAIATKIEASVRSGGADANAQLDTLVEKAKKLNVTKKIIENAIKRGLGELSVDGPSLTEVQYEFVGPGGVAIIITANTDNKARTVMLCKTAMSKFNANMSPCSYLFQKKGEIIFSPLNAEETLDDVLEVAIEIGAEDVEEFKDYEDEYPGEKLFRIITEATELNAVSNNLSKLGYKLKDAKTSLIADADNEVPFPEEYAKSFNRAISELDAVAEVSEYYTNIKEED
ncbi:transcriptional regulator TACO1-like protein [Scheffersomyces xylosifermentans]|uniref:transcriptional regulator TACO1-like protein n=1 Tax=Scheffersomyces xylosifermentans TaxID=1304137 RepID=UPI00315CE3E6